MAREVRHQETTNPPLDFLDRAVVDTIRNGGVLICIDVVYPKMPVCFLSKEYVPLGTDWMFRSVSGDAYFRTVGWEKFVERIAKNGRGVEQHVPAAAEFTRWLRDNKEYTL